MDLTSAFSKGIEPSDSPLDKCTYSSTSYAWLKNKVFVVALSFHLVVKLRIDETCNFLFSLYCKVAAR